ncbi:hypothetical protein DSO57_1018065 [Entomophthora muscae]|uniref:Uncharacterized protein n=1 Tax=Entomophthora muscae TaxID=34485 RepID=A0ACC2RJ25_9FUNG|nr:hypothetical protein DSO57_1018065 [Entomophthora muscae]
MKYPPFEIAIRLIHIVRYVKGQLIEHPLCIVKYISRQVWKLGCNRSFTTTESKNRASATQVPTQEEDGRGENNKDVALTQPVQVAQGSKAQSINPRISKLIQKPTKVTTTKIVKNVTTKRVSLVYNPIYRHDGVPTTIMEKAKPVLGTK